MPVSHKNRRTATRRRRYLSDSRERYTPSITSGLLFNLPLRDDSRPLYSAVGTAAPGTETVDADGSYVARDTGFVTDATANTLRIEREGALMEVAGTNLSTYSEDFGTSWTPARSTVTKDSVVSPRGTQNADTINEDGTAADSHYVAKNFTVANSNQYEAFFYAKAAGRSWVYLYLPLTGGNVTGFWDLSSGVVGTKSATADSIDIEPAGGDWYKCSLVFTSGVADAGAVSFLVAPTASGVSTTYDGLSQASIYLWGAQVAASAGGSSYIPTAASAVTRDKDLLTYPTSGNMTATAGTILFALKHNALTATSYVFDARSDSNNGVVFYTNLHNLKPTLWVGNGGVQAAATSSIAIAAGTSAVLAGSWKANEFTMYVDGAEGSQDTSGLTSGTLGTNLSVGHGVLASNEQINGNIAHVLIYNRVLTPAEILKVTTEIKSWL